MTYTNPLEKTDEFPKTFIISDTHFSHQNIITFCDRPFSSVKDMNEMLVHYWNDVIRDCDTVIHLGDVGFNYSVLGKITMKLKGVKWLIRGNHDWSAERMEKIGFRCVTPDKHSAFHDLYGPREFYATHKPRDLPTFNPDRKRTVRFCGHEHNNMPVFIKWVRTSTDLAKPVMALNMSCEHWGYRPTPIMEAFDTFDLHINKYIK